MSTSLGRLEEESEGVMDIFENGERNEENKEREEAEDIESVESEDEEREQEERMEREEKVSPQPSQVIVNVGEQKSKGGRPKGSGSKRVIMEEIDPAELDAIVETFGISSSERWIDLFRRSPKSYMGENVEGYIEKYENDITLDEIKTRHGGGKFKMNIMGQKQLANGKIVNNAILRCVTFKISGKAKFPEFDEEPLGSTKQREPDIVDKVLQHSHDAAAMFRKDKEEEKEKSNELTKLLLMKKDDNKEIVELVRSMLDSNTESLKLQLETAKEAERRAREELIEERRIAREENKEMKRDMESKATSQVMPILDFMKQQSAENEKRNQERMSEMAKIAESNIKMIMVNNENQLKMTQEYSKMQVDILRAETERLAKQLNETKEQNRGGLTAELKNYQAISSIIKEVGGSGEISITDRLLNNLPEIAESIPSIFGALGSLLSKGTPRVVQGSGARAMLTPPARPIPAHGGAAEPPPASPPIEEEPSKPGLAEEEPREDDEQQKAMQEIAKIKVLAEEAVENGDEPKKFTEEKIFGKYDEDLLRQIAAQPISVILNQLQPSLEMDDSILLTVAGRDFLRGVHDCLKAKYL